MKTLPNLTITLILSLLAGCGAPSEDASKAIALFNGNNLDGWVIENNGQFSVENGVIKVNKGTGWLRSAEEYGDFTMTMEFRFLEKEANSGIFVRTGATSKDDENGWPDNGYQIQCIDMIEHQYPLAHLVPYGAPDFESVSDIDALKSVYKPAGEWQIYEITCDGETMEIKLNGAVITTATSIKNLTGHVGIQGELGLLEFRKIDVELL
ncbi:MAG: DUF1080 domain-containing protein [Verrucomicrobia bacterium]|nr:DUF1080 domain-containing protein [Verrucomicrobiota bacterium]